MELFRVRIKRDKGLDIGSLQTSFYGTNNQEKQECIF